MGRRTTAAVAALASVAVVAAGCGPDTDGSDPPSSITDTSAATAALWDPCTQIPAQVVQKIGLTPSSKRSGIAGVEEPGWKVCSWNNEDFSVGVFSTINKVDDFKKKADNIGFKDVTIAGRQGVEHRMASDRFDETCSLLFTAKHETLQILIRNQTSSSSATAPCTRAEQVAVSLVPIFPS
ncbi:DUF3558 domain-containing protein [Nocardia amamiensis]|uniref:DUF3558 domain-containing protein n=1 Tax=Nocardia amamiensis TaxID=404578 RepID=UPI000AA5CF81|nr:DUF3558 domain-containing protein [Nocardia amamiensis]